MVDLASMREAIKDLDSNPDKINPLVTIFSFVQLSSNNMPGNRPIKKDAWQYIVLLSICSIYLQLVCIMLRETGKYTSVSVHSHICVNKCIYRHCLVKLHLVIS